MKWYKRDPEAFAGGTAELSLEEVGAYSLVVDAYYARDGRLPDDDYLLSRILRCNPRTWRKIKIVLFKKRKLTVDDDLLIPNRGLSTLNEARTFSERQSNRARTRWEGNEKPHDIKDAAMPSTTTTTTTATEKDKKEPRDASARLFALEAAAEFNHFWAEYPNKVGKPKAAVSYLKARRNGAEAQAILEGLSRYIRDKPPDRAWLNPATFLNQQRWEDQPALGGHSGTDRQERHSLRAAFDRLDAALDGQAEAGELPLTPNLRLLSGGSV